MQVSANTVRTISQSGDHRDECRVEGVAVVVDACRVDIEDPGGLAGLDTKGLCRNNSRANAVEMSTVYSVQYMLYARQQCLV